MRLSAPLPCCTMRRAVKLKVGRLVARTIDAYPEVTTARFDMGTTMTLEVVGGTDPGKMTMTIDGSGAIDLADREMQMTMDMTMNIPGLF